MTTAALVLAGIAAALHVFIWTMESITWKQPATWKRFGLASQAEADTTAPMAYNQGYYNLFLAVITVIGIVLVVVADRHDAGWALVIAACGSMAAAALVLLSTGAGYARAAATQGTVPALAVLCAVLAIA
jgi:putative membrane protein